jgi:hypothetical protein
MRKSGTHISTPGLQPPKINRTLKDFQRDKKNAEPVKKTEQPTEEMVHRLNDIGKSYPFCVYFRHQVNDPL